jgi:hypothetical protein
VKERSIFVSGKNVGRSQSFVVAKSIFYVIDIARRKDEHWVKDELEV